MTLTVLMYQWFQNFEKFPDGSFIHKLELTNNLADIGVKIHVITVGNLILNHKNVICHHIKTDNKFISLIEYFILGIKLISANKFDVIYCRHPIFGLFGLILCSFTKSKLVYEVNGIRENNQNRADEHLKKVGIKNNVKMGFGTGVLIVFLDNYVAKHSDAVIAVTPKIVSYLHNKCKIPNKRIHLIYNGANTDLFSPLNEEVCRKELNLDLSNFYICFVGSLSPWHGVEYIIQSASMILKEVPNVRFVIVGDSPLKEEYIEMSRNLCVYEYFSFVGQVPYDKVPIYINACDICVSPFTNAIGEYVGVSPLKIYEYLACGKPVVSSKFPDLQFIEDSNCGILIEPENILELKRAVINLLNDKNLRLELGSNGANYIRIFNSWRSVADKTKKICVELKDN